MTKYEKDILNKIGQLVQDGKLSNDFLVSNLKLSVDFLNLQRISDYAKENGKSTQGLRGNKNIVKICNYQLIINNLWKENLKEKRTYSLMDGAINAT